MTKPALLLPPSQKPDLIGGHFRSFRKDQTGFLTRKAALGDVGYFRLGPQPGYSIFHPDLIRDILTVNAQKFIKGRALQRAKVLLGEGLLTSEGAFHLRQRRMIQPAFHRNRIAEYSRSMVEHAVKTADSWTDGDVRDIDKEMMHLTLRIVGQTLFSADVEDEADEVGQAMTTVTELFNFLLLPFSEWLQRIPIPPTRRFNRARDTFNSIIFGMIDERRRSGENKGDLLSMLLLAQDEDDASVMTDEQVRDEVLTLFLAGHETTANAMVWTWYLLSQNDEKEAKLHEELDHILAGRSPTIDDIPQLKYTEAVIAESMRLFPPAWTVGRLSIEDHEVGGYSVPSGSLLLASQYVLHRDPRFWDQPESFIPERWESQSTKEAGQKFIYFPFGGGVRRCIGEGFAWTEGILLLATLAQRWKLRIVPDQKVALHPMITLRPKFGMRMVCQKR
ncbi:MAG: cytochrome P450 [Pyrinomonadaceae bacterium]